MIGHAHVRSYVTAAIWKAKRIRRQMACSRTLGKSGSHSWVSEMVLGCLRPATQVLSSLLNLPVAVVSSVTSWVAGWVLFEKKSYRRAFTGISQAWSSKPSSSSLLSTAVSAFALPAVTLGQSTRASFRQLFRPSGISDATRMSLSLGVL